MRDAVAALAQLPPDEVGTVWIPDYVNPGRTTSFTGFGIDPASFGHRGYLPYRLVPDSGVVLDPQHNDTPDPPGALPVRREGGAEWRET